MKTCTLLILAVALFVIVVDEVTGKCCYGQFLGKYCRDCSYQTPYCGVGDCNIFGCQCIGGCRTGTCSWKRSSPEVPANPAAVFKMIDNNGDLGVDKGEFYESAKVVPWPAKSTRELSDEDFLTTEFEKMDKNGDGKISPGEFDDDLL